MELVALTEYNEDLVNKLGIFEQNANIKIPFMDKIAKIVTNKKKKGSNTELSDLVYTLKNGEINNLCYLKGNSDNRLIELEILNINEQHKRSNLNFTEAATNYAFTALNAETVTIFSNDFSDADLISIGYEPLGEYKGKNTYVKDREKQVESGAIRK